MGDNKEDKTSNENVWILVGTLQNYFLPISLDAEVKKIAKQICFWNHIPIIPATFTVDILF